MVSKEPATSALQLSDFDWKLLHTVASDKIASIKQPLLRLQLYTQPEHPTVPGTQALGKETVIELTKEQLDEMIREMSAVNESLGG